MAAAEYTLTRGTDTVTTSSTATRDYLVTQGWAVTTTVPAAAPTTSPVALDERLAALEADTDWANLTLQNGWLAYDGGTTFELPRYRRYANGLVEVEGLVTAGSLSLAIATLPVGFRPRKQRGFTTNGAQGGTGAVGWVRVDITPSGSILPNSGAGNAYLFLDGILFHADL